MQCRAAALVAPQLAAACRSLPQLAALAASDREAGRAAVQQHGPAEVADPVAFRHQLHYSRTWLLLSTRRYRSDGVAPRGFAFGLPAIRVDGDDLLLEPEPEPLPSP